MTHASSTIAALATSPMPAGIAVVRVSGERTRKILKALFKSKRSPVNHPRELIYGEVIDYKSSEVIDRAMAVFMPGPFSFTGEDIGEFHVHGSPALVQKILRSLYAFGAEPAQPGEFSQRAFLNGKMDLAQAEAVCDLINATNERALLLAGEQLRGKLSAVLGSIAEPLRDALAELEAGIDFPEEEIQPQNIARLNHVFELAEQRLEKLVASAAYGMVVREGFRVLLCGRANVGKSSLLNRLLAQERAIVSDISGTTRDLIEEQALIDGYRFVFCDSAGLRDAQDQVEKMGVELARGRIKWADLVLLVVDAQDRAGSWRAVLEELVPQARKVWLVVNKIDLDPQAFATIFSDSSQCAQNFYISVKNGEGYEALQAALVDEVKSSLPDRAEASGIVTNQRHIECLRRAGQALRRASEAARSKAPAEIVIIEVRAALSALDEIVGKTYNEDILGRIFSKFCIGK